MCIIIISKPRAFARDPFQPLDSLNSEYLYLTRSILLVEDEAQERNPSGILINTDNEMENSGVIFFVFLSSPASLCPLLLIYPLHPSPTRTRPGISSEEESTAILFSFHPHLELGPLSMCPHSSKGKSKCFKKIVLLYLILTILQKDLLLLKRLSF